MTMCKCQCSQRVEQLEQRVQELEGLVKEQQSDSTQDETDDLQEIVSDLQSQVDTLEEDRDRAARERADTNRRLTAVEEDVSQDTPETEETTTQEAETPLEDVIQLPEEVVGDNLTANQERARFVAKDILDYSRSVPAGYTIKSSQLRKVLTAKENSSAHTETVSRVIGRLDDLGKDDVQVRETRSGERAVVFTEEIVKRIVTYRNQNHSVVAGGKVSG